MKTKKLKITLSRAHSAPALPMQLKKEKRIDRFWFYLRLLCTKAAAMTAMITTAAAMAMYVVVGILLVGCGAMLGEGANEVGAEVGADVGATTDDGAGVTTAADAAGVTTNDVPAMLL
jgi:hypothetical protein